MRKISFLGNGNIANSIIRTLKGKDIGEIVFIQDINAIEGKMDGIDIVNTPSEERYKEIDLVIECATASALEENIEYILKNANLMMFSITALSSPGFEEKLYALAKQYNRKVYIPHGAIFGLDGIKDGRENWDSITIETIKSPKSLGRENELRQVVFEGSTREACKQYPRNVNVHAAIAIAGIGFDRTISKIISDPSVNTNSHNVIISGKGIDIKMNISSYTEGGVSGMYTLLSAANSVCNLLDEGKIINII